MHADTLARLDDAAERAGDIFTDLATIEGLDGDTAAAVAHAAKLLDVAGRILTDAYCEAAGVAVTAEPDDA